MLRDSAIVATGAVLLPSFFTGCRKEDFDELFEHHPKKGLTLTQVQLAAAADNLTTLRTLLKEVYELAAQYDDAVFQTLNSTKMDSWANFAVNIIIDIAVGLAAAGAIAAGGPTAIPAIAFVSSILKDWGLGKDRPSNLEAVFAEFEFGRIAMQNAIEDKLSLLVDPSNNYSNLTTAWKDPIVFNGNTYTLGDLASTKFTLGVEYNRIHAAAFTFLKKSVWNLLVMKCCSYYKYNYIYELPNNVTITSFVQQSFYPNHKGVYVRAFVDEKNSATTRWGLVYWNLGIGGYPFTDLASKILFVDDTPTHILNPEGLFARDYVFKQFSTTKPDFSEGHELGYDANSNFSGNDDWTFTGGMFPGLTK